MSSRNSQPNLARSIRLRRAVRCGVLAGLAGLVGLTLWGVAAQAVTATRLGDARAGYPRVIRLSHNGSADGRLMASVTTAGGVEAIFSSEDNGRSFTRVGSVLDPRRAQGQCCGDLYELPHRIGPLRAGTLLFAASYSQNAPPMAIDLWASDDLGARWRRLSTVVTESPSTPPGEGLWEPEIQATGNRLVVFYSDETQPGHSQALMETSSADGGRWSHPQAVVALSEQAARPGMATVTRLPDGTWFMTYELCGPGYGCAVYDRTSADGLRWGNPRSPGHRILTATGAHFDNTPTTAIIPTGTRAGELVLVGHFYVNASGAPLPGSGHTLLTNRDGGQGLWTPIASPVGVDPTRAKCANYSSSLLGLGHRSLLELAQYAVSPTECGTLFASGSLSAPAPSVRR